jgi:CRISPR-associated endonuclease/helicase Cas3
MTHQLAIDDFAAFFSEVRRHAARPSGSESVRAHLPFRWQERLARQVDETGVWPPVLDLPTGAGKTAVLDIAVFLLALDAQRGRLRLPRRTVLVVDRRIVVDQAAVAANDIRDALQSSQHPVLTAVRDALCGLSGTDVPLVGTTLRGGIVRDERWARRPDVPALISATVDQVGSRLLFRGYGLSDSMRPIHAGLLGNDALVCLDEVHLARPFAQTLASVRGRYRNAEQAWSSDRWQIVEMSATPGAEGPGTFGLRSEDFDPGRSPVLVRRLAARKPTELRRIGGKSASRAELGSACAQAAVELLARDFINTIGVVVNRVETAQLVAARLANRYHVDTLLLTGRMRPFDRDDLLAQHNRRLATGRVPRDDGAALAVVGTQCLEAGADFDFDGLVTECASLDALRQRFGRVDRAGDLSARGVSAPGIILGLTSELNAAADPVYGAAASRTWDWLQGLIDVDFGVQGLPGPDPGELEPLLAPHVESPVLLPAHLDSWVQTSPVPRPDPDVALWLHGVRRPSVDVQIVWRADLEESILAAASHHETRGNVVALVSACPPGNGEAATVPLQAVRRWLDGSPPSEGGVSDVEGPALEQAEDRSTQSSGCRPYVLWRGDDSYVSVSAIDIAPGDTVVVPNTYGGLKRASWEASCPAAVSDLGHRAQLGRPRAAVRLIPYLCSEVTVPLPDDEDVAPVNAVRSWLTENSAFIEDGPTRRAVQALAGAGTDLRVQRVVAPRYEAITTDGERERWRPTSKEREYFVCSAWRNPTVLSREIDGDADTEPATSSFADRREVPLDDHLAGVAEMARTLAEHCGLSPTVTRDVELAARFHDLGKLDPRFQRWLRGDELAAATADAPLAKSKHSRGNKRWRDAARARSGYPTGARHELLSVSLLQPRGDLLRTASDVELVLYLVGSHHGWARPFPPVVPDPSAPQIRGAVQGASFTGSASHGLDRLGSGLAERFWRLIEHYGWFGLSWLEAILRLADHAQSAREQATEEAGRWTT